MYCPVCRMVHIKDIVLLIGKSLQNGDRGVGGGRWFLSC